MKAAIVAVPTLMTADVLMPASRAGMASGSSICRRMVAGRPAVIDSSLSIQAKLALGQAVADALARSGNSLPDLGPAFEAQHPSAADRPEYARLEAELKDQARRAGTHAFSRSFIVAAALALAALVPLLYARLREERP